MQSTPSFLFISELSPPPPLCVVLAIAYHSLPQKFRHLTLSRLFSRFSQLAIRRSTWGESSVHGLKYSGSDHTMEWNVSPGMTQRQAIFNARGGGLACLADSGLVDACVSPIPPLLKGEEFGIVGLLIVAGIFHTSLC